MDLTKQPIVIPALLAAFLSLLWMSALRPVEGQNFDDFNPFSPFDNQTIVDDNITTTTTTNNGTAATATERIDNIGFSLNLSATSNNNTLLNEYVKAMRFYSGPLIREAIKDEVGAENAKSVRIVIIGFDGMTTHNTVGIDDAIPIMRSEISSLIREIQNTSTTVRVEIILDASQCSLADPTDSIEQCLFTIRLEHG
jgi:hypothetical protein